MPVLSPCTNYCTISPETRSCLGCGRTMKEIMEWHKMTEAQKAAIVDRVSRTST